MWCEDKYPGVSGGFGGEERLSVLLGGQELERGAGVQVVEESAVGATPPLPPGNGSALRLGTALGVGWLLGRKPDCDSRSHSSGAGDGDGAVNAFHAVGEADKPGPVLRVGAAQAVVADLELERSACGPSHRWPPARGRHAR